MTANSLFDRLSDAERRLVEVRVAAFEGQWNEKRLSVELRDLPPRLNPVRAVLLTALARADLCQRWRRGNQVAVETYLKACPELGDRDTVPMALLVAEYEARRTVAPAAVEDFVRRFPSRAEEIRAQLPGTSGAADTSSATVPPQSAGTAPGGGGRGTVLPEQFGRYRILREIGHGSMGTVYLAEDTHLGRHVALKIPDFACGDSPEIKARFFREARSAATIQHPNICPVFDSGEIGGVHFLAMAFVEGKSLAEVAKEAVPPRQAAALVQKLASALAEAHAHQIIHRDLKPANVMMNKRGEPILMDFGLALRINQTDERLTQHGAVLGTPAYMAPEQVSGDVAAHGPKMDVYSLGALLYRLLSGRAPFAGQMAHVLVQVLHDQPAPLSSLQPGIGPELEAICLRAMAKKPEDRFASMKEFATALTRYLKGQPAPEPDPSTHPTVTRPANPEPSVSRPTAREGADIPSRTGPPIRLREHDEQTHPIDADRGRQRAAQNKGEDETQRTPAGSRSSEVRRRKRSGMSLGAWLGLGGVALTLIVLVSVGVWALLRTDNKPSPDDRGRPGREEKPRAALPRGWVRFSPPGNFLSVGLPGEPVVKTLPITAGALKADQIQYIVREGRNGYVVAYAEFPGQVFTDKDLDGSFSKVSEGIMTSLKDPMLIQQRRIVLDGFAGVESEVEGEMNQQRMHFISRLYLVRHRMITLMIMVPPEDAASEKVKAFFDSFQLTP